MTGISTTVLFFGLLAYALASLALAVWTVKRPAAAAGLMAAVTPLEKLSVYKGLTVKPFLVLLPGALLAAVGRGDYHLRVNRFEGLLAAIMAAALVSLIGAIDPWRGFRMWVQFGFLAVLAIATARLITNRDEVRIYFRWFLGGSALAVVYGLVQFGGFLVGKDGHLLLELARRNPTLPQMLVEPGSVTLFEGQRMVRLSSFFFDWNIYGTYLVGVGALLVARAGARLRTDSLTIPALYALMAVGLSWFLTFSRSAWLGGFAALLILWWLRSGVGAVLMRYGSIVLAPLAALFLLRFNVFQVVAARWNASLAGERSIVEHATYGWAALEMMLEHPLLGIGLHNFAPAYQAGIDPYQPGATAHSSFLSLAAEMGLIGVVLFVWLLFEVLSKARSASLVCPPDSEGSWQLAGLQAALIGFAVASVFYHLYTQPFVWALLGAAWALGRVYGEDRDPVG